MYFKGPRPLVMGPGPGALDGSLPIYQGGSPRPMSMGVHHMPQMMAENEFFSAGNYAPGYHIGALQYAFNDGHQFSGGHADQSSNSSSSSSSSSSNNINVGNNNLNNNSNNNSNPSGGGSGAAPLRTQFLGNKKNFEK